jgi:CheY-like chemotaxis protein
MGSVSPARVIVVDDEPSICSLVRDILEHAGYVVATSTVPHQALDLVKQSDRFDLAIIDVVMPGMPGDELATAMRAVDPDLNVLFLTGYPGALFQARPTLWAGEAFLEKPCSDTALLEAVSLLLTHRIPRLTGSSGASVTSPDKPEPLF